MLLANELTSLSQLANADTRRRESRKRGFERVKKPITTSSLAFQNQYFISVWNLRAGSCPNYRRTLYYLYSYFYLVRNICFDNYLVKTK